MAKGLARLAVAGTSSGDEGRTWHTSFDEGTRNVHDYPSFLSLLPAARGRDASTSMPLAPDDSTSVAHDHSKTVDHPLVAWRHGQVRTARVPLAARGNSRR